MAPLNLTRTSSDSSPQPGDMSSMFSAQRIDHQCGAALGRAVQGAFHLRTCWMRGREIVAGGAAVPARMSGQAWKWKLPVCSGTRLEARVRGRAGEGERIVWPAHGAQGLS